MFRQFEFRLLAVLFFVPLPVWAQTTLSDFNGTGFNYTFSGFEQHPSPTMVRLSDPNDGWGGAGLAIDQNLASFAEGRIGVDVWVHEGSHVDSFTVELFDVNDNTGKWEFPVSQLPTNTLVEMTSATILAEPQSGIGDWQNLDLSQISRVQVLGEWQSERPFDISFDRIYASNDLAAPPPYAGHEPNAPWRAMAEQRIDQVRKADMWISVTDQRGIPLPNATVDVRMQRHAFGFGAAVQAHRLRDSNPENDAYKQKVAEVFNIATLENNLKWPAWEGEWGSNFTQRGAINAIRWLSEQNVAVRGHVLVWPGANHLPNRLQTQLENVPLNATQQETLRDAIASHIANEAGRLAGSLSAWDVVNEPRTNHDVMDALNEGDGAMVSWFQQAAASDPNASLYLNEFGILTSSGSTDTNNQRQLFETLDYLLQNDAPIDGVGLQGHFRESSLTGPEQIWSILDRYTELGLDVQITEFDFATDDEQLQAEFTRDFLTAIFAHEGVDDFITWVFWEGAGWRPNAGMYREDWSLKPNGQVFEDLVFRQWWTDESIVTDGGGRHMVRGFKGDYILTATYDGVSQSIDVLLGDDGGTADIALPWALGDFDRNGAFTCDEMDLLVSAVVDGVNDSIHDVNVDGVVNEEDVRVWLEAAGDTNTGVASGYSLGDVNLDGIVDDQDFATINANLFTENAGWCGGDLNVDGLVDGSDVNVWLEHRGESNRSTIVVPEPSGCVSMLWLLVLALGRRWQR